MRSWPVPVRLAAVAAALALLPGCVSVGDDTGGEAATPSRPPERAGEEVVGGGGPGSPAGGSGHGAAAEARARKDAKADGAPARERGVRADEDAGVAAEREPEDAPGEAVEDGEVDEGGSSQEPPPPSAPAAPAPSEDDGPDPVPTRPPPPAPTATEPPEPTPPREPSSPALPEPTDVVPSSAAHEPPDSPLAYREPAPRAGIPV
ncbi:MULTISPECIES: hypothetical protein [unclassified Streptomyces]|uniref:hypothetical protein n=1 Tax=unclassified Streptomyces TaxID=2593676 RepID=UPI00190759A1|nr:hypothetical protein [Streptomyces sp. HSG2]